MFHLEQTRLLRFIHTRERRPIYLDLCVNCVIFSAWLLALTIPVRSRFRRSLRSLHTKANVSRNHLNKRKTSMSYIMMVHKFHTYFDIKTFLWCLPLFCVNIPLLRCVHMYSHNARASQKFNIVSVVYTLAVSGKYWTLTMTLDVNRPLEPIGWWCRLCFSVCIPVVWMSPYKMRHLSNARNVLDYTELTLQKRFLLLARRSHEEGKKTSKRLKALACSFSGVCECDHLANWTVAQSGGLSERRGDKQSL